MRRRWPDLGWCSPRERVREPLAEARSAWRVQRKLETTFQTSLFRTSFAGECVSEFAARPSGEESESLRLARWEDSGGEVRVERLDDCRASVELRACTGELMERWITHDPVVIQRVKTKGEN